MSNPRPALARGPVRITAKETLTPLMVRITVDTSRLPGIAFTYPAHAVKLFVPFEGATVARTYTVRHHDVAQQRMDLDFILHGHGPAASWAQQAQVGDEIELAGPRAGFARHPEAAWQLLIGDATALPAMASMLESLPAGDRAVAFIAVRDAAEEQAIHTQAQAQVHWVHADLESPAGTAAALQQALLAADLPEGPAQVFIAAESSAVRTLRGLFPQAERAVEGGSAKALAAYIGRLHATGYWKSGTQDYHDHH